MDEHAVLKTFIETKLLADTTMQIGHQDDLLLGGLVNSLDVMRLVAFTQESFGVKIPAEDVVIENFQSIDAIVRYVRTRK
jgi:acyl carrier protein